METSDNKTIGQESQQMGASEMQPEQRRDFIRKLLARDYSGIERRQEVCEAHGEYESTLYPTGWSICDSCQAVRDEERRKEEWEQRKKDDEAQRIQRLLKRAAIPPRFADRRLSTYVPTCAESEKALGLAKKYADEFESAKETGAGLILCGGVGTGKTHIAVGIAHEIIERGMSAVFTSVFGAVRRVKETYRRDSEETETDVIKGFVSPDLLILDEVGVQFGSDTEKLIMFEIINGRYEEMKPTIIISNLAKDSLGQFIGERVIDRLREGGGKLIAFDWPSYRRQA